MMSKVYLYKCKSDNNQDTLLDNINNLFESTDFLSKISKKDKILIKTNLPKYDSSKLFEEKTFKKISEIIKQKDYMTTHIDTDTFYHHKKNNEKKYHLNNKTESELNEENSVDIEVNQNIFKIIHILKEVHESKSIILFSNVKAHAFTGLSGALTNLGIGCASKKGKIEEHKIIQPIISKVRCLTCRDCIKSCPENAIKLESLVTIDYDICTGCNYCVEICRPNAINLKQFKSKEFTQGIIEYAYGTVLHKKDKSIYVNFLINITPYYNFKGIDNKSIVNDIGILISDDPVAIDKASYDLINKQKGNEDSSLITNHEINEDKFKGIWRLVDSQVQFDYAEKLGLGNQVYELIEI